MGLGDAVLMTGYISLDLEFWANVDVFCLPSRSEGRSLALLEAMANRLACVASDIPANRELLDPGRGFLFQPGSDAGLATHLRELVRDGTLRDRIGENAHDWIRRNATFERVVAAMERVYADVGDHH
jgi:glycosyltransferase involved in cell wall biosynthesis